MDVCRQTEPPFELAHGSSVHRAACHLDAETQRSEAEKLVAETMASAG
jgi:hypothetical protein